MTFSARREIGYGLGCYAVYLGVRAIVMRRAGRRRADRNARRIVAVERRLRLDLEVRAQRVTMRRRRMLAPLNAAYLALNTFLTVGCLIVLFRRRDPSFHRLRRAAVIAHAAAQPVFLVFPTAPPRTLEGFVDIFREGGLDLESRPIVWLYNPVAAMPSIHVAYAIVTTASIARRSRLALAYPCVVALVVVATGNHYVLDVAAGAALGAVALKAA